MKKTIKINLSGIIFHIDEDAYERLNDYLDKIHGHFKGREGGDEIINDIEMRMAELFQARLSDHKQVLSLADVEEVSKNMGDPKDFIEEEEKTESAGRSRKLYRDPEHGILGGVASGMGAYLNVDPVWIRLIFVLLMLGYGFIALVYLLLWLFVPKATTYKQKLEMRGENITISHIEQRVKEEYDEVRSSVRKYQRSEQYKNMTRGLNEIFMVLGRILKGAFQVILILIGAALIITGISIILGLFGATFIHWPFPVFDVFGSGEPSLTFLASSLVGNTSMILMGVAVALLLVIPVFVVLYTGIKLLTGFGRKDKGILLAGLVVWLVALALAGGTVVWQVRDFSVRTYTSQETILETSEAETMLLDINESADPAYYVDDLPFLDDQEELKGTDKAGNLYIGPRINILKSPDDAYRLTIKKWSRGPSLRQAARLAESIRYKWNIQDSTLMLDSHFRIEHSSPYRIQQVTVSVYVPEGKRIAIPAEAEQYLGRARNDQNLWRYEIGGKIWEMNKEELTLYKKLN
ncbi:MAG TPA: PspC domain-containing protein [Bacteroidales bacterium]|nr:PspC domain-containing protein [Bacteroidales bacterium]